MALHVDLRARELESQGWTVPEARAQAEREVGSPEQVVPQVARLAAATDRRSALAQWFDEAGQDVRYAWRSGRRSPGFTVLVILTIALGLGANTAIFGVVNVAVLQPLPFDPDHTLVRVQEFRQNADGSIVRVGASRRTSDAIADRPDLFTRTVALAGVGLTMTGASDAVRVSGMRVAPGFTQTVGITPILGRTFTADEERAGDAGPAALISHRLWQRVFGADPAILGHTMILDGHAREIVGVLPVNFAVPYNTEVWFPSTFDEDERGLFVLARLAPGVSLTQVQAALSPVAEELNRRYPETLLGLGITAVDARDYFAGDDAQLPLILMVAVALLLLIGCSNVALLLTTKFASRQTEVGLRAALGCSRARQIRQFVTEGVILFLVGGALGLAVAIALRDSLIILLPDVIATEVGVDGIPLDWRLVGFSGVLALVTGLGFGLLAALRTTRTDLQAVMKASGRSVSRATGRGTLGGLAVFEVALALVLLFSAGVVAQTFWRLSTRDSGFDTNQVLTMRLDLTGERYASEEARRLFLNRVVEGIAQLPEVESVGSTSVNPLCCGDWGAGVTPEGQPPASRERIPVVQHFIVTPGYFSTLHQALIDGRDFTASDAPGSEPVVIVDEAMAQRFWPGESALGKRVKRGMPSDPRPWLTVVGVVASTRQNGDFPESWYLPFQQNATGPSADQAHLMIRSHTDAAALSASVRAAVARVDPSLALYDVRTMDSLRADALSQERMGAWVSGLFASAGVLLAALGLYGVLSFVVAGDRTEIAVRRALGASWQNVLGLVLRRGMRLVGVGLVVGAATCWQVARLLPSVMSSIEPDLRMIGVAACVIYGAALVAMVAPARRALRLDPIAAIRG